MRHHAGHGASSFTSSSSGMRPPPHAPQTFKGGPKRSRPGKAPLPPPAAAAASNDTEERLEDEFGDLDLEEEVLPDSDTDGFVVDGGAFETQAGALYSPPTARRRPAERLRGPFLQHSNLAEMDGVGRFSEESDGQPRWRGRGSSDGSGSGSSSSSSSSSRRRSSSRRAAAAMTSTKGEADPMVTLASVSKRYGNHTALHSPPKLRKSRGQAPSAPPPPPMPPPSSSSTSLDMFNSATEPATDESRQIKPVQPDFDIGQVDDLGFGRTIVVKSKGNGKSTKTEEKNRT